MKTTKELSCQVRRLREIILGLNIEIDRLKEKCKEKCDSLEKDKQFYSDLCNQKSDIISKMAKNISIITEGEEWKSGHTLPTPEAPAPKVDKTIDQMTDEEINRLIEKKTKKG